MRGEERGRNRVFLVLAVLATAFGVCFALLSGTWSMGTLGLAVGAGVMLLGIHTLVGSGDRAIGWMLVSVGALTVAGHLVELSFLAGWM